MSGSTSTLLWFALGAAADRCEREQADGLVLSVVFDALEMIFEGLPDLALTIFGDIERSLP